MNKILLRVNANTKTPTCQELLGQKKRMHLTSFQYLLDSLEKDLKERVGAPNAEERKRCDFSYFDFERAQSGLVTTIMEKGRIFHDAHKAVCAAMYSDEGIYRNIVAESLEVITMGQKTFQLWLDGIRTVWEINRSSLLDCHRLWTAEQRTRLKLCPEKDREKLALDLCHSMGLFRTSVDEQSLFGETPLLSAAANGAR